MWPCYDGGHNTCSCYNTLEAEHTLEVIELWIPDCPCLAMGPMRPPVSSKRSTVGPLLPALCQGSAAADVGRCGGRGGRQFCAVGAVCFSHLNQNARYIVSRSTKDDRLLQRLFSFLVWRQETLTTEIIWFSWLVRLLYLVSGELKVVNQLGGGSDGSLP